LRECYIPFLWLSLVARRGWRCVSWTRKKQGRRGCGWVSSRKTQETRCAIFYFYMQLHTSTRLSSAARRCRCTSSCLWTAGPYLGYRILLLFRTIHGLYKPYPGLVVHSNPGNLFQGSLHTPPFSEIISLAGHGKDGCRCKNSKFSRNEASNPPLLLAHLVTIRNVPLFLKHGKWELVSMPCTKSRSVVEHLHSDHCRLSAVGCRLNRVALFASTISQSSTAYTC